MNLRFFKRIKLAPGLSLNLSKSGGTVSLGPPGLKYTIGASGRRGTVGLPGTGLYYTGRIGTNGKRAHAESHAAADTPDPAARLDLGFFQRLVTPANEEHFVDGMRAYLQGSDARAIVLLDAPDAPADALFLAGMLLLKAGRFSDALARFDRAGKDPAALGSSFAKYGLHAEVRLPVTGRIIAVIEPGPRGIALARAEAQQALGNWRDALATLEGLHGKAPADAVGILSLSEILVEDQADEAAYRRVVQLAADTRNELELDAAILYWKGRALQALEMFTAACDALTEAFRRKRDRDPELLRAIQYQRALVYDALGQHARARAEFGRIYADDPGYADVARRIGRCRPDARRQQDCRASN